MPVRFKILQFNMQFGQGWRTEDPDNAPINLALTIAEIKKHDADLICLQEVERAEPGGTQPPMPPNYTRLCEELSGYDSYFAFPREDPRELPFGIGLAIFARTPLRDCARRDLPSPPLGFKFDGVQKTPTDRLLISATTTIGGRDIRVMNTHLLAFFMLNSSSDVHGEQRRMVVEELRNSSAPTVLAGDFNVRQHESLVAQFGAAGYRTVQSEEITWRRFPYVLDHVFYSGHFRLRSHAVHPTPASDHHALVAEFELTDS
ncbi:MAG: endonuclease/exonuclease/phosphatase family protein [Candidatus Didemnitutus sp.]|nr:endonuclease/exonuclease/phosphatase family protein [Candidatus Didemnitutus sp.]